MKRDLLADFAQADTVAMPSPAQLRAMLPTIVSQLVVVLKDTALGFLILYPELLYQARFLGSQGQLGSPILPVAMVIAAIYITMCLLLSQFAHFLERRTRRTRRVDPAAPVDDTPAEACRYAVGPTPDRRDDVAVIAVRFD